MYNQFKTAILLGGLTALIVFFGAVFGGEGGMYIAFILVMVIQTAISRSREFLADSTGATLAGQPEGLARALSRLGQASGRLPKEANPSTAHMFIVNPLSGKRMTRLFSTHPPLEERITRLREMR